MTCNQRCIGEASNDYLEVGFPLIMPRKVMTFNTSLNQTANDYYRTYNANSPVNVWCKVYAGSNVGDFVYYAGALNVSPIVTENFQTISSVEIECNEDYQIPTN